jgi:general secretion pathway protein L
MKGLMPQSGIGIEYEGEVLRAVLVRRHGRRARVADTLEIPEYRELGAAECGRRYREFLRRHGLKAPQTVVSLPRRATLLRLLEFPKTAEKELARAIAYQMDAYHPFEEGSVYWDYAVWQWPVEGAWGKLRGSPAEEGGAKLETLLGIAQRQEVDETAAWLEEAGIPVSQFGVGAALAIAAFWPALQAAFPEARTLFLLRAGAERAEMVAFAPGLDAAWFESTAEDEGSREAMAEGMQRHLESARSSLRVEPGERVPLIVCGDSEAAAACLPGEELPFRVTAAEELLPSLAADAKGFQWERGWAAVAAGLAAASGGGLAALNLLPAEKRKFESGWVNVPTYALAVVVAALALALGARGPVQDWLYSRHLEREMQALRPQVRELEAAQTGAENAQARLRLLGEARQSARVPLAILNELTRLLPQEVWLQQFSYDGQTVNLTGTAPAASGLLQTLAESAYFENPQFRSSISRTREGEERFTITARVRGAGTEGAPQ